jgi:hypothetical protein
MKAGIEVKAACAVSGVGSAGIGFLRLGVTPRFTNVESFHKDEEQRICSNLISPPLIG